MSNILLKNFKAIMISCIIAFTVNACKNNAGISTNSMHSLNHTRLGPLTLQDYEHLARLKAEHETGPLDGMTPGTGWSSDAQHIAPVECFSPLQVVRDGNMSTFRAEYISDINKLSDFLDLSVALHGGYGQFGTNDSLEFIKELNSDNLAMTFNFSEKISRNVTIKYSPLVSKLLNQDGKDIYNDETENPLFRLFCGDKLVSGYQEGAFIILSMQVIMTDMQQKQLLQSRLGANITSFAELAGAINWNRMIFNLHGAVTIHGLQIGGDPSQLSKALSSSIVSCSLDKIDECQKSMAGLINYANNSLPTQFDKPGAYTPIGGVKTSWDLAEDLQMKLAPSYVNMDVINARQQLINISEANRSNYSHLTAVADGYPIPLDQDYRKRVIDAKNISYYNSLKLQDAPDCWDMPHRCLKLKDNIINSLVSQPDKDLLMNFGLGCSIFVPVIGDNASFSATFFPNRPNSEAILKSPADTSVRYYPLVGHGGCDTRIVGNAHDGGLSQPSVYMIDINQNQAKMTWYNARGDIGHYNPQFYLLPLSDINVRLS